MQWPLIRNEMLKTTTKTTTSTQKPRWKWSGDDEPQSYYDHDDNDTMTLNIHEVNYIRWYHAHANTTWHNTDED
jgi:hypothetical protein